MVREGRRKEDLVANSPTSGISSGAGYREKSGLFCFVGLDCYIFSILFFFITVILMEPLVKTSDKLLGSRFLEKSDHEQAR